MGIYISTNDYFLEGIQKGQLVFDTIKEYWLSMKEKTTVCVL
jgi:hypothetical protein